MSLSKKSIFTILISLIVLLFGALILSGVTIYNKNQYISEIKTQITQNESMISDKSAETAELESQLENSSKEKEKLEKQLEKAKSEKEKLEKENSKLKKEIETLKLKKKAEAQAAVNAAGASGSKPSSSKPSVSKPSASAEQEPKLPALKGNIKTPNNSSKVCYLTFDDGPSTNTLEILKILNKYKVKATFFVVTKAANINYVKNIHKAGHTIGLHSYTHDYEKIYSSPEAYFTDLNLISDTVESLTGVKSKIIRFPGGSSNAISKKVCPTPGLMTKLAAQTTKKGYYYYDWNVDSGDASASLVSYTTIVNNVLNGAKGKNNICVLMHDSYAKTTTVDALPFIIEGLARQGFSFRGLSPEAPGFRHGITN